MKFPFGSFPEQMVHCFTIHGASRRIGIISNLHEYQRDSNTLINIDLEIKSQDPNHFWMKSFIWKKERTKWVDGTPTTEVTPVTIW